VKLLIIKSFVLILFCAFGIVSIIGIDKNLKYEKTKPNLIEEVRAKVENNYLDKKIIEAINHEKFDDVEMYQNLADMVGINLTQQTLDLIASHNSIAEKSWRNTKEFTSGFFTGTSKSAIGMSGTIASDMTVYGDLRDLKIEGTKYQKGEAYDKFILQLSLVGIGLSATQLISVGVTTPLKVGVSIVKLAKKAGTLTKPFLKTLSKKLSKTVDIKILKSVKFSIFNLGDTTKTISKSVNFKPMSGILTDVNKIQRNSSIADTIGLLKYVESTKDLKKLGKISKQYKGNTKGILSVLGKTALRTGKLVIKYSVELIMMIIGFIFSMLGFFVTVSMRGFFKLPKKKVQVKKVVSKAKRSKK